MNELHKKYLEILLKEASTNIIKIKEEFINDKFAYGANRTFDNITDDFQKEDFIKEMMRIGFLTEHKIKDGFCYKFTQKAKDYYSEYIK